MSRRESLSLRTRFRWGFGIFALILVGATAFSGWWLRRATARVDEALAHSAEVQGLLAGFSDAVEEDLGAADRYLLTGEKDEEMAFRRESFEAERLSRRIGDAEAARSESVDLITQIQEDLSVTEAVLARAHRLADLGRTAEALAAADGVADRRGRIKRSLARLGEISIRDRTQVMEAAVSGSRRAALALVGSVAVGFILLLVVAAGTAHSLAGAVDVLRHHADLLREGELDTRTDPARMPRELSGLAQALNEAGDSLKEVAHAQDALRQAEKLSAIGMLVSGVAHELNNPLAGILLACEEGLHASSAEELQGELAVIREEAYRARTTVRQLLAVSHEPQGELGPVRIQDALEELVPELEELGEARSVSVTVAWDDRLPTVWADRDALRQVIRNLADNATWAAEGGGGNVEITAAREDHRVVVRVEDDGPGLPPEIRSRVFDPFFSTRGEASGLGLSVVLGLVQDLGGTVYSEDREGSGARFVVELPVMPSRPSSEKAGEATAPPGDVATQVHPEPPEETPAPPVATGRILVVDDEDPIRRVLRRVLERAGWTVDEARDGREALDKILECDAREPYQVVVSDLKMPNMSGMELVDQVATRLPGLTSRFVIITGDNLAPGPAEFLRRTELPVVDKPFEMAELLATIQDVGGKAPSREVS
jgi:signal transduction histidine kinase/CheY-like chemotaxis protein